MVNKWRRGEVDGDQIPWMTPREYGADLDEAIRFLRKHKR